MEAMTNKQVLDMVMSRPITVELTRADERRLSAQADRILDEDPNAFPFHETWDETLGVLILGAMEWGLDESERTAGLASTNWGELYPRPKPKLRRRLENAWRELRGR
jgi:hypothetical protein